MEVRGEVDGLRDGSGPKNSGEAAGAMSGGERRLCSACLLHAGARRMKRKRKGSSLTTWPHRLSGERLHRHTATRGGANAEIGGELGETGVHRSDRCPKLV